MARFDKYYKFISVFLESDDKSSMKANLYRGEVSRFRKKFGNYIEFTEVSNSRLQGNIRSYIITKK